MLFLRRRAGWQKYVWKLPPMLTIEAFLSKTAQLLAPCRRILVARVPDKRCLQPPKSLKEKVSGYENLSSTQFFSANISCSPKVLLWPVRPFARDGSFCSRVTLHGLIKRSEVWGGTLMCSQKCTGEADMQIVPRMQFRERRSWLYGKWTNASMPLKSGTLS
jgi:hypothetical protein